MPGNFAIATAGEELPIYARQKAGAVSPPVQDLEVLWRLVFLHHHLMSHALVVHHHAFAALMFHGHVMHLLLHGGFGATSKDRHSEKYRENRSYHDQFLSCDC